MTEFRTSIRRHANLDVTVVEASGLLSAVSSDAMRDTLTGCFAECPAAVIVDLSRCALETPAAAAVFDTVTHAKRELPEVDLLLCDGGARLSGLSYPSFPRPNDALAAAATLRARYPVRRVDIVRAPAAPAQARVAVRQACQEWGVGEVGDDAALICSELVTNAVQYARATSGLEVLLRDRYLHIRVSDGSDEPPQPQSGGMPTSPLDHGRGLPLVALLSTAWGYLIDDDGPGKVVWATLRTV